MTPSLSSSASLSSLAKLLLAIPAGRRGALMQCVISFQPNETLEASFSVGPLRAAFAEFWEVEVGMVVPVKALQVILDPPIPIGTVVEFGKLGIARDAAEIELFLSQLVRHFCERLRKLKTSQQQYLFEGQIKIPAMNGKPRMAGSTVQNLKELVDQEKKFPTFYADPPWKYENDASRAAAINHYSTMSLDEICAEPVRELAEDNAHLHLWTTNGLLREAFSVIDAWGFKFKSCLVWIKGDIGMGNYWRVSHEFLLLGVRGRLTFRDRTLPSWIQSDRTIHSRKPGAVRALIERASPGPYLELYGREQLHDSAWTVYGNQVEPRLF